MPIIPCAKCSGEGTIYNSRYGGNDPNVWAAGECGACGGSGNQKCDSRSCHEDAVAFNDDGEALCADCLSEWISEMNGDQP